MSSTEWPEADERRSGDIGRRASDRRAMDEAEYLDHAWVDDVPAAPMPEPWSSVVDASFVPFSFGWWGALLVALGAIVAGGLLVGEGIARVVEWWER